MKKIVIAIVTAVAAVATGIGARLVIKKKTRKFADVNLDTTTTE